MHFSDNDDIKTRLNALMKMQKKTFYLQRFISISETDGDLKVEFLYVKTQWFVIMAFNGARIMQQCKYIPIL